MPLMRSVGPALGLLLAAALLLWVGTPAARAQAAAPVESAAAGVLHPQGHGWFTWRDAADRSTMVLHLPPRGRAVPLGSGDDGATQGPGRSGDGVVRLAPGIAQSVQQIAWWHQRVYLLLQEDRTAPIDRSDWLRRIVTLTAVRSGVSPGGGGEPGWQYPPGRPVVVATMKARSSEVLAFGACRLGPVVLIRHGPRGEWLAESGETTSPPQPENAGAGPLAGVSAVTDTRTPVATGASLVPPSTPPAGQFELAVFAGSAWRRLELPDSLQPVGTLGPAPRVWMAGHANELTMYVLDPSLGGIVASTIEIPESVSQGWVGGRWSNRRLSLIAASGRLPDPDVVARVDGVTLAAKWSPGRDASGGGRVRLFYWPGEPRRAAAPIDPAIVPPHEGPSVGGVPTPAKHRIVPMDGSGRLAVIWADEPPGGGGGGGARRETHRGRRAFQIREVSVSTGAILYEGPLRADSWLSLREYQLLALLLVLVMGSVVVFVLRSDPARPPALPAGVVMAEPGRRLAATLLDYVPAALVVESLWSLPSGTLLLPSRVFGDQFELVAFVAALLLAAAHATLGEWMFGRSLGKLLTGCAVAGVLRAGREDELAAGPPSAEESGGPVGLSEPSSTRAVTLARPALWQCLLRNLMKWPLPILGIFILIDPGRRHPGDLLARTLVLLPLARENV